jgi:hypothetical protein
LKKRRTVITTETAEVYLVRKAGRPAIAMWCERCSAEVTMLTPDQAVAMTGASARSIFRRAEAGEVHAVETPEGLLLICVNSLIGSNPKTDGDRDETLPAKLEPDHEKSNE